MLLHRIFLCLLLVSSAGAYHGFDYGTHYGPYSYDYYGSSLYGYSYRPLDNYYTAYYPLYRYPYQRHTYYYDYPRYDDFP